MQKLRPELVPVLEQCFAISENTGALDIDQLGDAIGTRAVSTDDIDALIDALEAGGRKVNAPPSGGLEQALGQVVRAAAALKRELARKPTMEEVAARAGLEERVVRHALALLRIMQR